MSETDVIDRVLKTAPGDKIDRLRRGREDARLRAQTSYVALFEPAHLGLLSAHERFAAAARVAEVSQAEPLAHVYTQLRDAHERPEPARLAAILAHAETVGRAPAQASRPELARLASAGLTPAAIVTLSQIIGLVAYQVRVVAALSVLGAKA